MTVHGEWQTTLYGSPALQVVTSILVLGAVVVFTRLAGRLRSVLGERYSDDAAEAVAMLALSATVAAAAGLLAEIWAIPYVFEQALEIVTLDRWTVVRLAVSGAVLASGYLFIRMANRSFDRLHGEGGITNHQKEVAYHVVDAGIFALAAVAVLAVWGIELTSLVLGAGVLSAVLGLAAQKTVAAVIAGFLLLFARPFRVGDWIAVAGADGGRAAGVVQDVTISHTKLLTFNDEHVLVPNDEVTANRVTNYTHSDRLRVDVEVGVDYATDLDRAREVLVEAAEAVDLVSPVKEPKAVCKRFGDSEVVLELQFWIENPARRRALRARSDVVVAVKAAFDREGIAIPFPQRTHQPRSGAGFPVETPAETDERSADRRFEPGSPAEDD